MAGDCRLERVIRFADLQPLAVASLNSASAGESSEGGPLVLEHATLTPVQVGGTLRLVLYWHTESPVNTRYTVFTHLFDASGALVAQQDNWPVLGLAPTDTWQVGTLVRDPYQLPLPPTAAAGNYELWIGLYDERGRSTLTLANGSQSDHLTLPVQVDRP
jgi:hypothetical protein